MPQFSERHQRRLIDISAILYTLSLHKYVIRDALSTNTGVQGPLEFGLISAALACSFLATRQAPRRYAASPALICFAAYGIFALASSWRSFNPALSLAKGLLLFCVLATGYMTNQAGLSTRFFQSVYWSYTVSLVLGLMLGLALPGQFPLWTADEFTGRTRLSVYATFPGTMGETAAYLILLSPLIFRRFHWISRLFLVAMNFAAGGKTSTAVLVLLLAFEYVAKIRAMRSWRVVALVGFICFVVPAIAYLALSNHAGVELANRSMNAIYGHDVSAEAVSLDGRVALWRSAVDLLMDSPVLGYGFDGAREVLLNTAAWSGSSHNGFLEMGLAGGIGALCIFVVGFGIVLRACWRSTPPLRGRALLVLAYMLPIAFTGITFNFPSYLGLLILVLLVYQAAAPAYVLLAATTAPWPGAAALDRNEEHPCRA